METATILQNEINMYKANYDFESPYNISDLNNKLFCTFTTLEGLEGLVKSLSSKYSIMYNKIFVLDNTLTSLYNNNNSSYEFAVTLYVTICFFPISGLLMKQIYLFSINLTTYESIHYEELFEKKKDWYLLAM